MKKTIQSLSLAIVLLGFLGCAKKSDPILNYIKPSVGISPDGNGASVNGATVKVYNSEAEFLSNAAPPYQSTFTSNLDGRIVVPDQKNYYVYVEYQTSSYNEYKGKFTNVRANKYRKPSWDGNNYIVNQSLTPNPVKLKVSVNVGGNPVSGAAITLYGSLSDYQNNIPLYSSGTATSTRDFYTGFVYGVGVDLKTIYTDTTDATGSYTFSELEPKQYWVKVTSGNLNNAAGVINTVGALPDDLNATTTLSIQIQ